VIYVLGIGILLIILAGVIFRKHLVNVSPVWLLVFMAGVLATIGTERATKAAQDLRRKIPL